MFRKTSLFVTLLVIAGLALPFQSLTRLSSALARAAGKAPVAAPTPEAANARAAETFGKLPLHFEPLPNDGGFVSRGLRYNLFLDSGGAKLALKNDAGRTTVRMQLAGAVVQQPVGVGRQAAVSNYYFGSDPEKWRTGVRRFARIKYSQVYPGVDLVFYGNQRQLEYDFIVAPGADPHQIKLSF
ncbi:MAG TPA: hypothetical protein PKC13_15950, partial [Blastocatellia bacterium]|nr:hypothetical protein [Blastocatellia bacterium]